MYLQRNFVWTLNLSDRELKLLIKLLRDEDLTDDEQSLSEKLADTLPENATRLERASVGKHYKNKRLSRG